MCPECQRIEAENKRLQRMKIAADKLIAVLHVNYSGESKAGKIVRNQIDEYTEIVGQ
jgi:hypothetical protein